MEQWLVALLVDPWVASVVDLSAVLLVDQSVDLLAAVLVALLDDVWVDS